MARKIRENIVRTISWESLKSQTGEPVTVRGADSPEALRGDLRYSPGRDEFWICAGGEKRVLEVGDRVSVTYRATLTYRGRKLPGMRRRVTRLDYILTRGYQG